LLTVNATIMNPAQIEGKNFTCTIIGDETVQHFGVDIPGYPPAQIYLECTKMAPSLKEEATEEIMPTQGRE